MLKKSVAILSAVIVILLIQTFPAVAGNCGDINNDGSAANVADLTYLVDYLFRGGTPPPQMYASDVNGDGTVTPNVADLTYLVDYMFRGGPPLMCRISTPNTTTIIPPDSAMIIQGYDTAAGVVTMDESSYYAQQIAVGDIIIGQDDVEAPNGFLRKAASITTQGGSIVIETAPATMMEAFEELNIDETHPLNPADVKSVKLFNGTTFQPNKDGQTFDVGLNCVLYDLDGDPGTTDDQIRLDGAYAFTADLFAKVKIKWFSLKRFEVGLETDEQVNLDLIANLQWEFNDAVEFDLAEFHLGAIPVGGAVWLVPTLTVEAHIHGDLTVTFETGITYTQQLRYGFGWADDAYYTISEGTKNFTYTPPQFSAEFNFEPGTSLNASCLLYGVAGPYVAAKTGFHFLAALNADPCDVELLFDLEAILYAVAGIECDLVNLDYNYQWQLYTHLIGQWNYPLGGTGTISIDPEPDAINAPWSLTGPCSYSHSGNGDNTLTGLDPGDYTITWEAVAGWTTPSNSTQSLVADQTITFTGTYVEEPTTGTIVIDASPDALNAPWSLAGPNSYATSGNGDATLPDLEPGDYTITWGSVTGWITPSNSTQSVAADQTITFSGTYTEESTGTVTDIDGNVYQTVMIGDQEWMAENLKVTHYRNGDPIPNVTDNSTWENLTTGAYCNYNNEEGNVATYGRLYNWYAVNDSRNIAPAGWHVPTDEEWKQLEMYLGMSQAEADGTGWRGTDEGGKLKEAGTTHWSSPNTGATNESGFTALPGGARYSDGTFLGMGNLAYFWASTEDDSNDAWTRDLYYSGSQVLRSISGKQSGFSVRCVRD